MTNDSQRAALEPLLAVDDPIAVGRDVVLAGARRAAASRSGVILVGEALAEVTPWSRP
jgi:hypothetical protein